eukprot:5410622-Amphidinium_carterae.6
MTTSSSLSAGPVLSPMASFNEPVWNVVPQLVIHNSIYNRCSIQKRILISSMWKFKWWTQTRYLPSHQCRCHCADDDSYCLPAMILGPRATAYAALWCQCYNSLFTEFVKATANRRWGSAPDAIVYCKLKKQGEDTGAAIACHDAIKPRVNSGPDEYIVFDRRGNAKSVRRFSQFTRLSVLSSGEA